MGSWQRIVDREVLGAAVTQVVDGAVQYVARLSSHAGLGVIGEGITGYEVQPAGVAAAGQGGVAPSRYIVSEPRTKASSQVSPCALSPVTA